VTSNQLSGITAEVNAICEGTGVVCRYEYDRKKHKFQWNFYRRGTFVGGTARESEVRAKAKRLVQTRG